MEVGAYAEAFESTIGLPKVRYPPATDYLLQTRIAFWNFKELFRIAKSWII